MNFIFGSLCLWTTETGGRIQSMMGLLVTWSGVMPEMSSSTCKGWSLVSVLTAGCSVPSHCPLQPHFLSAAVSSLQQVTELCCRWRLQAAALQASAKPAPSNPVSSRQVQARQSTWRVKINMQPNTNRLTIYGENDWQFINWTRL